MPNLYLATAQGLILNGVYTPFATPVSIDANYPYTQPLYRDWETVSDIPSHRYRAYLYGDEPHANAKGV